MSYKSKGFRHLIRVRGTDLEGDLPVKLGISKVTGVNIRLAQAIIRVLDISPDTRIGTLTDTRIKEIENVINNPQDYDIPVWLYNRRKDRTTGEDVHLSENDLILQQRRDIERYIKIRCRRGIRHQLRLKVRGQKTRTHTAKKGGTIGVSKKKR